MGNTYKFTLTVALMGCILLSLLYWIKRDQNDGSTLKYNTAASSNFIDQKNRYQSQERQRAVIQEDKENGTSSDVMDQILSNRNHGNEAIVYKTTNQPEVLNHLSTKPPLHQEIPRWVDEYGATYFNIKDLNISKYTNKTPLIPHIIHQTWDTYNIPTMFVPWIQKLVKAHPDWQYWFWTAKDIECYFKTKHSDFYTTFINYPRVIYKADVMRYFILYDYGGFYMDLDIEVLKPLDIWTHVSESIVSHENYEHSYIVWPKMSRPNLLNAIMATKPGHGYYKMLQDNLKPYWTKYQNMLLESTGPFFIDSIYNQYKQNPLGEPMTVIAPKYWLPTYDPVMAGKIRLACSKGVFQKKMMQNICAKQARENYSNKPGQDAFLNHHWVHSYVQRASFKTTNLQSVLTAIPNVVKVSEKLNLKC